MPFELAISEEVAAGVRRLAAERLAEAAGALQPRRPSDDGVHAARKRLKELRALLRMLRRVLPTAVRRRENAAYRDAARPLSRVRDAAVLVETFDALVDGQRVDGAASVRAALVRARRAEGEAARQSDTVDAVRAALDRGLKRVAVWRLPKAKGFAVLGPGIEHTYRQGKRLMKVALADPTDDRLHEWRKRSKDLRYQLEVLLPINGPDMRPLARLAKDLTDVLGQEHDLAVLAEVLNRESGIAGRDRARDGLRSMVNKRRRKLQARAEKLGRDLYDEKPKRFVGRIEEWWDQSHGP